MNFTRFSNLLTVPIKRSGALKGSTLKKSGGACAGFAGQLQQVRHHGPICGPPRFPISTGQKLILGWGSLLLMMVIPYWALSQMPRWSALHNNLPWGEEETDEQK